MIRTVRPFGAGLAAVALVASGMLAGCSSSEGTNSTESKDSIYQPGLRGQQGGDPVKGDVLTFSAFSEAASLDPAAAIVAGSTGGIEMTAIFDTLMRYDAEKGTVVPQLAEALTPNEDATSWTLTLREDTVFSDGTPLDAEAVIWSIERFVAGGRGDGALWTKHVKEMTAVGATTVRFDLDETWPAFDSILAGGMGMVVAKASGSGTEFTPIGAGPFVLDSYSPKEALELKANPAYVGGAPNLEGVRVVFLNDPSAMVDSLDAGEIDGAFLRDPAAVDGMLEEDASGYLEVVSGGQISLINSAEGRPGADPRVREAMNLAIDPNMYRERGQGGHGIAGGTMFAPTSPFHAAIDGVGYDPERAKELVEEAKADGFDGKLQYLTAGSPDLKTKAMAVAAMLGAVGFDVSVDVVPTSADTIQRVVIDRDYDLAAWASSWREADIFPRMFSTLGSEGSATYGIATSPERDELIAAVKRAATPEDLKAAVQAVAEELGESFPVVILGAAPEMVVFSDEVHGLKTGAASTVVLDDAWIG